MDHFEQLIQCLEAGNVAPFIGAGLSVAGGFPSWKEHLRQQGRTAGINNAHIEDLLAKGQYEIIQTFFISCFHFFAFSCQKIFFLA
jgi:hypothetical protein